MQDDFAGLAVFVVSVLFLASLGAFGLWGIAWLINRFPVDAAKASANRARAKAQAYADWQYRLEANALTCTRCGKLAYPILQTADRYNCPDCGNQFVGGRHKMPLPPVDITPLDEHHDE